MLDLKSCEVITNNVEKLATCGKEELDTTLFKTLAVEAGKDEEHLKFCLDSLIRQLRRKHSEIRLGAFIVIDALFRRSDKFRELLLDQFQEFLEHTVETNANNALPPPKAAAKKLKTKTLQAIQVWKTKYGQEHKRLELAYNFLQFNTKVDFEDAEKRNQQELELNRQKETKRLQLLKDKINVIKTEFEESSEEMSRAVTEINNCFKILVPVPEDLFKDEGVGECQKSNGSLREHGISGPTYTLSITIPTKNKLMKTEENEALVEKFMELYHLLKRNYLPKINKWAQIVVKSDEEEAFLKKLLDIKQMIASEIHRMDQLELSCLGDSSGESSDSDFEYVPEKEGYEEEVSEPQPGCSKNCLLDRFMNKDSTQTLFPSSSSSQSENKSMKPLACTITDAWQPWDPRQDSSDPTSFSATNEAVKNKMLKTLENAGSLQSKTAICKESSEQSGIEALPNTTNESNRKQRLLKIAPKLPFDVDLYHWEDEDLKAPSVEIVETDGHRFWAPSQDRAGESFELPGGVSNLRTRVIEFTGKFEPVRWSCRAPLASGSLCPRKDRLKCPFHGIIIPRNKAGEPTNEKDKARILAEQEKSESEKVPEWQDPELLKDIQAEIGIDLKVGKKRRKGKRTFAEMYPSLTDINKKRNAPRARLEKKVFSKSAVKKVCEALDSFNKRRFRDKFGDQWNYQMNL